MAGFLTPLELEYLDGHLWEVLKEFEYSVGAENSPIKVVVPKGFITDFASVPRMLWNIFPPTGAYGKAAVIHDYLYQHPWVNIPGPVTTKIIDRKQCDDIFYEAMGVLNVGTWTKRLVYSAVRVGGFKPWGDYRAKGQL